MMHEYSHEYAEHLYHTPTSLQKHGGIIPIRIGYNEAKSNYRIGPRFIVYYSLHFVLEGSVLFRSNGQETQLSAGDVFILFPHELHEYLVDPNSPETLRLFWLAAEGKQMPLLIRKLGLNANLPYAKSFFSSSLRPLLFELFERWKESGRDDDLALTHQLYGLLNRLIAERGHSSAAHKSSDDWIKTSLEYIHLYYMEGISVQDIADHVGIHRAHFSKVFLEKVGVRPQQFLTDLIMKKAIEMVRYTSLAISHIALSLGYADLYSFTHAFKNYYGSSPSHFRQAE